MDGKPELNYPLPPAPRFIVHGRIQNHRNPRRSGLAGGDELGAIDLGGDERERSWEPADDQPEVGVDGRCSPRCAASRSLSSASTASSSTSQRRTLFWGRSASDLDDGEAAPGRGRGTGAEAREASLLEAFKVGVWSGSGTVARGSPLLGRVLFACFRAGGRRDVQRATLPTSIYGTVAQG